MIKIMQGMMLIWIVLAMVGCKTFGTDVLVLNQNRIMVTVRAALKCKSMDVYNYSLRQAALETLKRGYNHFMVVESDTDTYEVPPSNPNASAMESLARIVAQIKYNEQHYTLDIVMLNEMPSETKSLVFDAASVLGKDWEQIVKDGQQQKGCKPAVN